MSWNNFFQVFKGTRTPFTKIFGTKEDEIGKSSLPAGHHWITLDNGDHVLIREDGGGPGGGGTIVAHSAAEADKYFASIGHKVSETKESPKATSKPKAKPKEKTEEVTAEGSDLKDYKVQKNEDGYFDWSDPKTIEAQGGIQNSIKLEKKWHKEASAEVADRLKTQQKAGVKSYTYSFQSAGDVNQYLRTGLITNPSREGAIKTLGRRLDSIYEDSRRSAFPFATLREDTTLFRGINSSWVAKQVDLLLENKLDDRGKRFLADSINDNGFVSTTTNLGRAFDYARDYQTKNEDNGVVLRILAAEGTEAIPVTSMSQFERDREILLRRGCKYEVVDASIHIYVDEKGEEHMRRMLTVRLKQVAASELKEI